MQHYKDVSPFAFQVLKLIESTISDKRVAVELIKGFDPLPVSSYDEHTFGYQIIKKTANDIFPQVTVTPGKTFKQYCPISVTWSLYQHL